jgi:uridine kinase
MIGIGGGSAAGKTTLARRLAAGLAPLTVEIIGQDRFFKPAPELPACPSPTRPRPWPDYIRPDSFYLEKLLDACRSLAGMDVVILEGILVLHYPELRRLMTLRLYIEADADERIVRRIRRNLQAGMDLDDIADYYALVRELDPTHPPTVLHNSSTSAARDFEVNRPVVVTYDFYPFFWNPRSGPSTPQRSLRMLRQRIDKFYVPARKAGASLWLMPQVP